MAYSPKGEFLAYGEVDLTGIEVVVWFLVRTLSKSWLWIQVVEEMTGFRVGVQRMLRIRCKF
jgi:hypothetical protein